MTRLLILCMLFGFAHAIAEPECLKNAELALGKCVSGLDGFSDKSCKNGDLKQCASALAKQACKDPEKVKDSIRCLFKDFVNPCAYELEASILKGTIFDYGIVYIDSYRQMMIEEFRASIVPRKAALLNLVSYLCQPREIQSKECDFEVLFPAVSMCVERKMRGTKFYPLIACKLFRDEVPECLTEHASKCPSGVIKLWQHTFKSVLPPGCTNYYEFNWPPLPAEAKTTRIEYQAVRSLIKDIFPKILAKFDKCSKYVNGIVIPDCKPQDADYSNCMKIEGLCGQLDKVKAYLACIFEAFKDALHTVNGHLFKKVASDVSHRMVSHTFVDAETLSDALDYFCNDTDERDGNCAFNATEASNECILDRGKPPAAKLLLTLFTEGTLEDWVHYNQLASCTLYKSAVDCPRRALSACSSRTREILTEFTRRFTPEACIIADVSRNETPRQKDEL